MSFAETRLDDGLIIYNTDGSGGGYKTDVVVDNAGIENRDQVWEYPLGAWNIGPRSQDPTDRAFFVAFFHARRGKFQAFRVKDWDDYTVTNALTTITQGGASVSTQGWLFGITPAGVSVSNTGTGYPTYQLGKVYQDAWATQGRKIQKPVSGQVSPYRGGTAMVAGAGAGEYSVDTTTGILTISPDATSAASGITPSTSTQVVLATNPGTLTVGQLLYLSGFTGADAALVNGIAHTITNIVGTGPYTFTISTDTLGKTITLGSGQGSRYPQTSETLTWGGQFDVPVRFDVDRLPGQFTSANIGFPGQVNEAFFDLPTVPIVEVRV